MSGQFGLSFRSSFARESGDVKRKSEWRKRKRLPAQRKETKAGNQCVLHSLLFLSSRTHCLDNHWRPTKQKKWKLAVIVRQELNSRNELSHTSRKEKEVCVKSDRFLELISWVVKVRARQVWPCRRFFLSCGVCINGQTFRLALTLDGLCLTKKEKKKRN